MIPWGLDLDLLMSSPSVLCFRGQTQCLPKVLALFDFASFFHCLMQKEGKRPEDGRVCGGATC